MDQILDTGTIGLLETFTPKKEMTIADLLKELKLENKFFGILVDGKKATPETMITPENNVVILPHIAGG